MAKKRALALSVSKIVSTKEGPLRRRSNRGPARNTRRPVRRRSRHGSPRCVHRWRSSRCDWSDRWRRQQNAPHGRLSPINPFHCPLGRPRAAQIQLVGVRLQAVICHRDRCRVERVGLDDIGAGFEILNVNGRDQVRLRDAQQIVAALQIAAVIGESLAAKFLFVQACGVWIIVPIAPSRMRILSVNSCRKRVFNLIHRFVFLDRFTRWLCRQVRARDENFHRPIAVARHFLAGIRSG